MNPKPDFPQPDVRSENTRRNFLKKAAGLTAVLSVGGVLPGFSAQRILGANEKVRVGMMGVNSRGLALAGNFARPLGSLSQLPVSGLLRGVWPYH